MYAKVDIARIYSTIMTKMCTNIKLYADYTNDISGFINTDMLNIVLYILYCLFVRECKLNDRSYRTKKLVES